MSATFSNETELQERLVRLRERAERAESVAADLASELQKYHRQSPNHETLLMLVRQAKELIPDDANQRCESWHKWVREVGL